MRKTLEEQIKDIKDKAAAQVDEDIKRATEREAQRERVRKANEEARKQAEQLRARLEEEHDMANHPKRDKLWSKAWEHGHAAGLDDVDTWYSDLVELVK